MCVCVDIVLNRDEYKFDFNVLPSNNTKMRNHCKTL